MSTYQRREWFPDPRRSEMGVSWMLARDLLVFCPRPFLHHCPDSASLSPVPAPAPRGTSDGWKHHNKNNAYCELLINGLFSSKNYE